MIDGQDEDTIDGGNSQKTTVAVLNISLEIIPEHCRNLAHVSNWKLEFSQYIMSHLYC